MRTVHREQIMADDKVHSVRMTHESRIVHVQWVGQDRADFWYTTDQVDECYRNFILTGTGHEAPKNGRYVGCAGRNDWGLVWHLWEVPFGGG